MTLCGGNGMVCVDRAGRPLWSREGLHYESVDVGPLCTGLPGPQMAVDITHSREPYKDPLLFLDAEGRLFGRVYGLRVRQHFNIDWLGNGLEQTVIPTGDRVIFDAEAGEVIARLETPQPDDLAPFTAIGSRNRDHARFADYLHMGFPADMTGDGRQDIVLHTNPGTSVWIYRNELAKPTARHTGSEPNYTIY